MAALPSYPTHLGSHPSAGLTLMVSCHALQDSGSTKACWDFILQAAEHLVRVFAITPVSVGDGAE